VPSQSIAWSQIQAVVGNGNTVMRVNRSGGVRLWEKVWVQSTLATRISQGYTYDPPAYYTRVDGYLSGWWDTSGGTFMGSTWGVDYPVYGPSNTNYGGWSVITGYYGYSQVWQWSNEDFHGDVYIDPGPYWVDTSYWVYTDNSYWAYYY
jgi:hypothetical protein